MDMMVEVGEGSDVSCIGSDLKVLSFVFFFKVIGVEWLVFGEVCVLLFN